jgi:pyrimidine-nucleoside phosphorylase
MTDMIEILERKRDGKSLSTAQIEWFIASYTAGDIPEYQVSALLMAIFIQGMSERETVDLTLAMARSGDQLDFHELNPFVVDKHSSGGVGDKTTLVVQPIVAACGIPVGKMSGRGLGISGGTLDKMESIRGWSFDLSLDQFKKQLGEIGLVLGGQTADLAPADGKLYALRDVTGTIASMPLIAASIMSKKLAGGADAVVLDVKVGTGSFMPTLEKARNLAQLMVDIGSGAKLKTVALISDMNQPLGHAVGNALEVKEAIETLNGSGPTDFWEHCLEVAGHMLLLSSEVASLEEAKVMTENACKSGQAMEKFRQMVAAQGGDLDMVDNPERLPQASIIETVTSPRAGYVSIIDAGQIGLSCLQLGAGRKVKGDEIDLAVGMIIPTKVGDSVQEGDILGTLYASDRRKCDVAKIELLSAFQWSESPVPPLPLFYETIS